MIRILYTLPALFAFVFSMAQSGEEWQRKISISVKEAITQNKAIPVLILLPQADVSGAKALSTKNEKTLFVFNTLRHHAVKTQKSVRYYLDRNNIRYQSLFIVNVIRAEAHPDLIEALAMRDDVVQIMEDIAIHHSEPVESEPDVSIGRQVIEWGIERINADDVWAMGFRGQNVVVGGEDTGYEWRHPALISQYRGYVEDPDTADHNYNWHDAIHSISPLNADSLNPCGLDSPEPCDDRGHGTHTMGTMIGMDGDNQIGVAPDAKWCGCRNMERGWGSPFTYLECFQWFLGPTDLNNENPDPLKSPHVINNSWSCPAVEGCDTSNWELMNLTINNLRLGGIVVVVSAGNSGPGCGTVAAPPGMFEGSLSVGATAINDTIAGFSARGPVVVDSSFRLKPNVAAPGVAVRSAQLNANYGTSSGTSMAGPHVAGVVALMISANPDLAGQVDTIENVIERTAVPKTTDQTCGNIPGSEVPNHTYGYGRIDALAAVQAALDLIEVSVANDGSEPEVRMYPNPAQDEVYITSIQLQGSVSLELFDMQGRKSLSHKWMHNNSVSKVDIHHIPAGIYFYRIVAEEKMAQGKIIKQ